jgi:hypothetical protein
MLVSNTMSPVIDALWLSQNSRQFRFRRRPGSAETAAAGVRAIAAPA